MSVEPTTSNATAQPEANQGEAQAQPAAQPQSPVQETKPVNIDVPEVDFELPVLPKASNGSDIKSVLGDDRAKAFTHFEQMWEQAGKDAPVLGDDPKAHLEAMARYHANPLTAFRKQYKQEYIENVQAVGEEKAAKMYEYQAQGLANKFMNGLDRGFEDPSINTNRQGAFQQLIGGDFIGAIKTFAFTIPFVGDLVAAMGKWVMNRVNGNPLSFAEAREHIKLEKAYGGAAAALGIDAGVMNAEGKEFFAAPKPAPVIKPKASIELEEGFDQNKAHEEVKRQLASGAIDFKEGKYFATEEALATIDKVPSIIGKRDDSWAASR